MPLAHPSWAPTAAVIPEQPEPGVENVPGIEQAFADGTARQPDTSSRWNLTSQAVIPVPRIDPPHPQPAGSPREARHPALAGSLVPPSPGSDEWNQAQRGLHAEVGSGAEQPRGDQAPWEGVANTWRLEPAPSDTALYFGAMAPPS